MPSLASAQLKDGVILQTDNGDYTLRFGMVVQADGRFTIDDPSHAVTDTFVLRRVRPTFSGRLSKYFEFKVMPDFGNGMTVMQDAYFDIRFSDAFRVRAGKDKTPIGLELLQGDSFLLFAERALASSLLPKRDVGFQVMGEVAGGLVGYASGVFNGVPDGVNATSDIDTNSGKDVAGRLVVRPFRKTASKPLADLLLGIGGSTGRQTGALPVFKTSVQQTFFAYDEHATADGVRTRLSPQVSYYYKAFGAFGEYVRTTQPVTKGAVHNAITNEAWEVTASFLVTGETAGDRGVTPKSDLDPPHGKWGALQLLARYGALTVDPQTFALGLADPQASRQAQSFAVGANWYPSSIVKYYLDFERTVFDGDPHGPRPSENAIVLRAQVAF